MIDWFWMVVYAEFEALQKAAWFNMKITWWNEVGHEQNDPVRRWTVPTVISWDCDGLIARDYMAQIAKFGLTLWVMLVQSIAYKDIGLSLPQWCKQNFSNERRPLNFTWKNDLWTSFHLS